METRFRAGFLYPLEGTATLARNPSAPAGGGLFILRADLRAIFTAHPGFRNAECPANFKPRESIELRTLVGYP
jgi:hypothetical protein